MQAERVNRQVWFNRINRMNYDYLICHKNSYPLLVVELDIQCTSGQIAEMPAAAKIWLCPVRGSKLSVGGNKTCSLRSRVGQCCDNNTQGFKSG